jgi:hypothetical protein
MRALQVLLVVGCLIAFGIYNINSCVKNSTKGNWQLSEIAEGFSDGFHSNLVGNGIMASSVREIPTFTSVVIEGSTDLEIVAGDSNQKVVVEGDSNLLSNIITEVNNGVLTIRAEKGYHSKNALIVKANVASLSKMEIQGSSDITAKNLKNADTEIEIAGSGNITVDGVTQNLKVYVAGSGDVSAEKLTANNANLQIDGSGNVSAHCSNDLDIEINGSGDISYIGNPKNVRSTVNGSGEVVKK